MCCHTTAPLALVQLLRCQSQTPNVLHMQRAAPGNGSRNLMACIQLGTRCMTLSGWFQSVTSAQPLVHVGHVQPPD
jgi:hypothetical protein